MEFKIGDKVKHKEYGFGEIVYIQVDDKHCPYAVKFEKPNDSLYGLGTYGAPQVENKYGYWCVEEKLELLERKPQNLIPQFAKMLGVEIGEEFYLRENFENDTNMNIYKFVEDGLKLKTNYGWEYVTLLDELLAGKYTIQKLPKKPILTEDEKVILRNLPKGYKWIARDHDKELLISELKLRKRRDTASCWQSDSLRYYFDIFRHLFQFIKWEDEEPYNIKELLEE